MTEKKLIDKLAGAGVPDDMQEPLAGIMLEIYAEGIEDGKQEAAEELEIEIAYRGHTADQLRYAIQLLQEMRDGFKDPLDVINELTGELCKLEKPLGYKPPENKRKLVNNKYQKSPAK